MSYTIKELATALGRSTKTCSRWIEQGMAIVPNSKNPIFIMGSAVKEFLRSKKLKHSVKLGRHEFYCFRCKVPRRAKRGSIAVSGSMKKAICSACNGKMVKTIKPYQKDYKIPTAPVQMSMFGNN